MKLGGRRKRSKTPLLLFGLLALAVSVAAVASVTSVRENLGFRNGSGSMLAADAGERGRQDGAPVETTNAPQCRFDEPSVLAGYESVEFGDSASDGESVALVVTHEKDGERIATLLVFEAQALLPRTATIGRVAGFDPLPRVFFDGKSPMVGAVVAASDGGIAQKRNILRRLVGETLEPVAEVVWPTSATSYDWTWHEGRGWFACDTVKGGKEQIELFDSKNPVAGKVFAAARPEELRFWSDQGNLALLWASSTLLPDLDGGDPNEAPGEARRNRYLMAAQLSVVGSLAGEARVVTDVSGHVGTFTVTERALYYLDQDEVAPGAGARLLKAALPHLGKSPSLVVEPPEVVAAGLDLYAGFDVVEETGQPYSLLSVVDHAGQAGLRRARPQSLFHHVGLSEHGDDAEAPPPAWPFRDEARLLGTVGARAGARVLGVEIRTLGGEPRTAKSKVQLRRFAVVCP